MEFVPGKTERFWPMTTMWTDKDVHDFICDIGFGKYASCFSNNAINGKGLIGITPFDLQRIGVTSMRDALHLHASIQATTHRFRYNWENPGEPPNISYSSTTRGHITNNPKLPPKLQPENSSAFHSGMPPIPGHPYNIDWKVLCLPYHRIGGRVHGCQTRRSFRDRQLATDKKDKWKLYDSHFP